MARGGVKTIDKSIDLSQYLKTARDLSTPFDVSRLFDASSRIEFLELEIGTGKGLFLRSAAKRFSDHRFVGIEISEKFSRFSAASLAKEHLQNAVMIHGDAAEILADVFPNDLFDAVHVYFPDPWWKRDHRKRRILREDVLKNIERILKPGGVLHFWTDVEEYYRSTLTLIAKATTLLGPFSVTENRPEHEFDYRTHFERRKRMAGLPIYRAEFRKNK